MMQRKWSAILSVRPTNFLTFAKCSWTGRRIRRHAASTSQASVERPTMHSKEMEAFINAINRGDQSCIQRFNPITHMLGSFVTQHSTGTLATAPHKREPILHLFYLFFGNTSSKHHKCLPCAYFYATTSNKASYCAFTNIILTMLQITIAKIA